MDSKLNKPSIRPIIIIIVVGLVLAGLGYKAMEYAGDSQQRNQFQQLAQKRSFLAEQQLDDVLDSLVALRTFYLASENVTATEFQIYANHLLNRYPGLIALLWAPVVNIANQVDTDNILPDDAQTTVYYPITYFAGTTQSALPLGLNLASLPDLHNQLQTQHRQQLIWQALGTLNGNSNERSYYITVLAVPNTIGNLMGYVAAVVDLSTLLDPIFQDATTPLYAQITLQHDRHITYTFGELNKPIIQYQRPLTVIGGNWDYQQSLLYQKLTWESLWPPLLIFISLLSIAIILAIYIKNKLEQQQRTEKVVKLRTQELSYTTARLKQRSLQLANINTELQQFAYVASHDLQAPLRMIQRYAELLQQELVNQANNDIGKQLQSIFVEIGHMDQLITGLLTYSRIENGNIEIKPVEMEHVVTAVLQKLADQIEQANAVVTHDELPTVYGDQVQLTSLLQNLISNAITYCHADVNPVVHISCVRQHDEWIFKVSDNGIGIPEVDHERVFDIFQRLHTHEQYPGTGIGLAICKKIVTRHRGHIWLESVPDEGTIFFFSLPVGQITKTNHTLKV